MPGKFFILSARYVGEAKEWRRYLAMLPYELRDVHFMPEYVDAFAGDDASPLLLVWEDDGGFATMQPVIMRKIAGSTDRWDLTCANFGGALTSATFVTPLAAIEFGRAKRKWALDAGIVSEFLLYNPMLLSHQLPLAMAMPGTMHARETLSPMHFERNVVVLPITYGDEGHRRVGMDDARAHAIKSAYAKQPTVTAFTSDPLDGASLQNFARLYDGLMERKGAALRWRKDQKFFADLFDRCDNQVFGIQALLGGPAAAAVFSRSGDYAYYEFAAATERPPQGLSDIAIDVGMAFAGKHGAGWLYLGGGLTNDPNDSLFAYKRSFGGIVLDVYSYREVVDHGAYIALSKGEAPIPAMGFFPHYRREEAEAA